MEKTENRRTGGRDGRGVDAADRKILTELTRDAGQSLSAVGATVGLSAPAVHERVKRMRAGGVIRQTVAQIDGAAVGKPLLAFVHVDTSGWGMTQALTSLSDYPEVEEIHSATGDACLIMKVRVADSLALEGLLAKLYDTNGVRGTRTYVVLSTHLERAPQPGITADLSSGPHVR